MAGVVGTATRSRKILKPEEELEDLRKRFFLMEGDRKACYENSQLLQQENKDKIAKLKGENKSLRQAIIDTHQVPKSRAQDTPKLEKKERDLYRLRSKLDDTMLEVSDKEKQLQSLYQIKRDLDLDEEGQKQHEGESEQAKRIRSLENRLDKAHIKFQEAQSIRRTYEKIVRRLQQDRLTYDTRLGKIEQTLKGKRKDFQGLDVMFRDAHHAKELAQNELLQLETKVAEDRKVREKELAERKELVRQTLEASEKMERRQQRLIMEDAMAATAAKESASVTSENEDEKVSTYEEAFRKIKETTGVSNVKEVIDKFLSQGTTQEHLRQMKDKSEERYDILKEERKTLAQQLDHLMYSSEVQSSARRYLDDVEAQLNAAVQKRDDKKGSVERLEHQMIHVKAGVQHLGNKLRGGTDEDIDTAIGENVVDGLTKCEELLNKMLSKVEEKKLQDVLPQYTQMEFKLPEYNVRITMAKDGDEDASSEEEGGGEEVLTRDAMKKQSSSLVEAKTHKKKAKKGKRTVKMSK